MMNQGRALPSLKPLPGQQIYPISFVTIHFSNDLEHNLLRSECVQEPFNQLVVVDNRFNIFHENLGRAVNSGMEQAIHDLVAVIHEDVLLPKHWQEHFSRSIDALESSGRKWGLLGSVGWIENPTTRAVELVGHWSDPYRYQNTLKNDCYKKVERIDEQIMVLRRSSGVRLDPNLPTIHNIGKDMPLNMAQKGLSTYVINAPTIHKYADAEGKPIKTIDDSPKILGRSSLGYKADKSLSDEYFERKWSNSTNLSEEVSAPHMPAVSTQPVILIAKGGGGSRLLAQLAMDLGIFLGNEVNVSGDSMELVLPIYRGVLRRYQEALKNERWRTPIEILAASASMWEKGGKPDVWGFKLPEAVFLLPELTQAFPGAKFIHMVRDPLQTCLRRTHMTGRLDNQIGRATVLAAYREIGIPIDEILTDGDGIRMAYTTRHQLQLIAETLGAKANRDRVLEIRFEDLVDAPAKTMDKVAEWLRLEAVGNQLIASIDSARASPKTQVYSPDEVVKITEILAPVRKHHGYLQGIERERLDFDPSSQRSNLKLFNCVHQILRPRRYLEIGVRWGDSLVLSGDRTFAIGIDPSPQLRMELPRRTWIVERTSDDFFQRFGLLGKLSPWKFDLALIDGMHLAEFVLRDFINVEKIMKRSGVIVLDDTNPPLAEWASRENTTGKWTGDVWKALALIIKYRPDLSVTTFDVQPAGVSVISGLNPKDSVLKDNYETLLEESEHLDFARDFERGLKKAVKTYSLDALISAVT
jgi:hypothetical protein